MSGGGGSNQTQTTNNQPWSEQKPFLISGMKAAQDLWHQPGPDFFPGSTVAPPSPGTQSYWDYVMGRGPGADAGVKQAQGFNADIMSGKYLNANPYDDQVYQNISSHILPSAASTAMTAGRSGSGLSQADTVGQLTQAYAPYASQNYNTGLGMMQNAAQLAPTLDQASYFHAGQVGQVGQQQHQQGQAEINDAVQRYNFYQQLPYNKLQDYLRNISGSYGGTSSTSTPTGSIWQTLLGAGISALGLFA